MGKFWNRQLNLLIVYLALLAGAILLLFNFFLSYQRREYGKTYAGIVGAVRTCYPDVEEEQIMKVLREAGDPELGGTVLAHYGVFSADDWTDREGVSLRNALGFGNLSLFLLCAAIPAGVLLWQRQRREKLLELCNYMDRVSHGDFELRVEENREDEFSGLRNELYKLTVFYKKQAEHAVENKRALADTVADISHQLKTPLTSMVVLADNLLENRGMDEEKRRQFLQEIARQLGGMKWLVTTMLKISRLDANVVTLEKKPVKVRELTQEIVRNLEMCAQWKDVRIETRGEDDCQITGDRKWLEEAMSNIVKNAIEHSPQSGVVKLSVQDNDVYTQITVSDQGEGIPPEQLRHLFERFYQGTSAGPDNVGIGLALAKEIVEKHDGYLTVESSAQGTTFFVKFIKCH